MRDPYDSIRQAMNSYRSSQDEIDRIARGAVASLVQDSALQELNRHNNLARAFAPDTYLPKNLIDYEKLMAGLIPDSLRSSYRPEGLARIDEMLDRISLGKDIYSQISTQITAIGQHFYQSNLESYNLLEDLYATIAKTQTQVASQLIATLQMNSIEPLLRSQSNWARTVRPLSSLEEFNRFTQVTRNVFEEIHALYKTLENFDTDRKESEEEGEITEHALEIVGERLTAVFAERRSLSTIQRFKTLLSQIIAEAPHIDPKVLKVILFLVAHLMMPFLLNIASNYTSDFLKSSHPPKGVGAPHIAKDVRREVTRLRQEALPVSPELRAVIVDKLIVRSGPGQKNRPLGQLYAGDLVYTVKTRTRSWSLVEFRDQDGETVLKGWVFTRHVRPLRGGTRRRSTME